MRTSLRKWCDTNENFASARLDLFQEASVVSAPSLTAWNQCQEIARKAVDISFSAQGEHSSFIHFEIDSTLDANLTFLGINEVGYTCETVMLDQQGEVIDNPVGQRIGNSNIQIDCQRDAPVISGVDGVGTVIYDQGYLVVNTSGPSLPIAFDGVVDTYFVTPPNSVLTFDQGFCPEGWEPFSAGAGRMILGVSEDYAVGETGGLASIPASGNHSHGGNTATIVDGNWEPTGQDRTGGSNRNHSHGIQTSSNGDHDHGGQNLPPYIALQFCKR